MIPYRSFITVHDSAQVRDSPDFGYDFSKNGLAVLFPTECTVTEELNGGYWCDLEHPIDPDGKWMHLNENNILSVPIVYHGEEKRQLFRIAVREVTDGDSGKRIRVQAHHIFYDLRGRVYLTPVIGNVTCNIAIKSIMSGAFTRGGEIGKTWYPYTTNSDIPARSTIYLWNKPMTLVDLLIGDDHSIADLYNGEIYRDNFYFSINSRKEGSIDHDIPIRYAANMLEITERADWSRYCNYARAYTTDANWIDVAFDTFGSAPGDIVKAQQFNYKNPTNAQLEEDMWAYFEQTAAPDMTYTVRFREIAGKPEYLEFYALKSYEVGDTVKVINERVGINAVQKVEKKVYDVVRRETQSLILGSIPFSIARKRKFEDTAYTSGEDVMELQQKVKSIEEEPGLYVGKAGTGTGSIILNYGKASGTGAVVDSNGTATGTYAHADSNGKARANYSHADSGGEVYEGANYAHANSLGYASGVGAFGCSKGTAAGNYSFACAQGSASGEGSMAGIGGNAQGMYSGAFGNDASWGRATTTADHAWAFGPGTKSAGTAAFTGGIGVENYRVAGVSFGKFNYNTRAAFSVGDGGSDNDRHDLFLITESGEVYVNDVMIFDGKKLIVP